jgi:large subunit ribosomal protein L32e
MKKRKFKRQCFWLKKLGTKWKRPKGRHSKLRHEKNGRWPVPKVGYGNRVSEKGKIMFKGEMLSPVMISSAGDLGRMDPKANVGIIAASVGARKAAEILSAAAQKGIRIANRKLKKEKAAEKKDAAKAEKREEKK